MSLSEIPRVVPWISAQEFNKAGDLLYSDNLDLCTQGVDLVKLWVCRGKVPATILITAQLVEVHLRDSLQSAPDSNLPSRLSNTELRLMYGLALIRFVNLLSDTEQRGAYAKSLMILAKKIGIPLWLVELRHNATHENLPSLTLLRLGCKRSLEYLYDNYWGLRLSSDTFEKETASESIKLLLNRFKNTRTKQLSEKNDTDEQNNYNEYSDILNELGSNIHKSTVASLMVPMLLDQSNDFMVPSTPSKRTKLPNCKLDEKTTAIYLPMFEMWYGTWGKNYFLSVIVDKIFETLSNKSIKLDGSSDTMCTLVGWILHLLSLDAFDGNSFDRRIITKKRKKVAYTDTKITNNDILSNCLYNPNIYTRVILNELIRLDSSLKSLVPISSYIRDLFMLDFTQNKKKALFDNKKVGSEEKNQFIINLHENMDSFEKVISNRIDEINKLDHDHEEATIKNIKSSGTNTNNFRNNRFNFDVSLENLQFVERFNSKQKDRSLLIFVTEPHNFIPSPIGCLPNGQLPNLDL
ncbi:hypothetical protein BB558_006749 [Smittium angustum]|uniref:Uncharacterized protein n=1 Tax=Smittium angustum TaxID=133377 RepID=A0A2U1IWM1_SMIAN|nr:hypothetical protein BB558_006826 [Smittium angustum]PVZ97292.1 hypothetical protein BB558_006749 [Smittium angustum]